MGAAPTPVRVLIADDDRLFVKGLMTTLLSDERVEVVGAAHDGREAVELAAEYEPDILLMDLYMPIVDGYEATRRIRALGGPTRIVLLTGSDAHLDESDLSSLGASAFLTKQQSLEELIAAFYDVTSLTVAIGAAGRDVDG